MKADVLVLGGGFGGINAALEARAHLPREHSVALVDAGASFRMGLANLRALDGRPVGEARPLSALDRRGVRVVQARITGIDPKTRRVETSVGGIEARQLVVALGAQLAPSRVQGLPATARDVYSLEGARAFHDDLARLRGGRVLLLAPVMPWKCPPAPYEAAALAKAFLRRRGVEAEVVLATAEPHPLPVFAPETGAVLKKAVEERGVVVRNQMQLTGFDGNQARFADGSTLAFDALAVVPPHVPPPVVAALSDPPGWLEVDRFTMASAWDGIWGVGDCALLKLPVGKPLPKAGVLAEGEGKTAGANAAARVLRKEPSARFDGKGVCYVELGDGVAIEGRGEFYAEPAPRMDAGPPTREGMAAKERWEAERLAAWFRE